jgi:uncharacterized membrane protein
MTQILILYLATLVPFLVLDALMLTFVMAPLFASHIGPLMAAPLRLLPAGAFYLSYVAGLLYLVSLPALREGAPVLLPAAVLGFLAYGTYEFTSYAILRDWHWRMLATDLVWGTALTALSAWAGLAITRAVLH